MMNRIVTKKVNYMPEQLQQGILYVSDEYRTAAHLCACECGEKIRTPLTPTEWRYTETPYGPSLFPSIGNWQIECQSHYWINQGVIRWADKWSPEQIAAGRHKEEERRRSYYSSRDSKAKWTQIGFFNWILRLIKNLFG